MKSGALWVLIVASAAAGCASQRSKGTETMPLVGTSQIDHFQNPPPGSSTSREKRPPLVIPPTPHNQELPDYPNSAVDEGVACVARVLYHVETTGQATLVRLEWDQPPPSKYLGEFEQAIEAAVLKWSYAPAVEIVGEKQDDGSVELVRTPVPSAQRAFIRFRVENGKAVVE